MKYFLKQVMIDRQYSILSYTNVTILEPFYAYREGKIINFEQGSKFDCMKVDGFGSLKNGNLETIYFMYVVQFDNNINHENSKHLNYIIPLKQFNEGFLGWVKSWF